MKITVWRGCKVVGEANVPKAPGPDLKVDPWAGLITFGSGATLRYDEFGIPNQNKPPAPPP